jgi:hypothetical protein
MVMSRRVVFTLVLAISLVVVGCSDTGSVDPDTIQAPTAPGEAVETDLVPPEEEPDQAATKLADFPAIKKSGKGSKVVKLAIPDNLAAAASFSYGGRGNFAVWEVDAGGDETDLLVNTIGKYKGAVLINTEGTLRALKVEADGSWKLTVRSLHDVKAWDPSTKYTGKGDTVLRVDPPTGEFEVATFRHKGKSNFAVIAYSPEGTELLVNEIGKYSGETILPDGTLLLEVTADGTWTVTPS